jgi:hypothetical protein
LVRSSTSLYDRADLISDLKVAGFDEVLAATIADRVDGRHGKDWTMDMARQEAIRQTQNLLVNAHEALDVFRTSTLTTVGQQDHLEREPSLSERLADSSLP